MNNRLINTSQACFQWLVFKGNATIRRVGPYSERRDVRPPQRAADTYLENDKLLNIQINQRKEPENQRKERENRM